MSAHRIVKLAQPAAMASAAIGPATPVAAPLGDPVSLCRTLGHAPGAQVSMGVWECSPGLWRRQVMRAEFSHLLEGRCRFIPDGGEPITLAAGDAVYFPPHSSGVWDISETVRKVYVIFDPA